MRKISVFDTTISDYNLGNQIIMEAVYKHLNEMFPSDFFFKVPYMEITRHTIDYLKRSDLTFFGGTNALTGQMERYKQWDLNLKKSFQIRDVILMGIGWWQYQNSTSLYTKIILKKVLSKQHLHSVRDSHTKEKLEELGLKNVFNTGCPTLWELSEDHCKQISKSKSNDVILTLTDYNKNIKRDSHLLKVLSKNYNTIYYWIQGEGDLDYINELKKNENIVLINPSLAAYDDILNKENIDYVGTRLHAGIRALQKKKRALIIGIDNRAIEMHKDFNIPVLYDSRIEELETKINKELSCDIKLPYKEIETWKGQFK
jgi:polysaccharide pyruvyl transferase WcaK-like protein